VSVIRRGRCVRADLGGGAFVLFVDVPDTLSAETRAVLNEVVLRARAAIAADLERKGRKANGGVQGSQPAPGEDAGRRP
jgi:hypothetical protein